MSNPSTQASPLAGVVAIVCSLGGSTFLAHFLWQGLSTGAVPGKLGAIHYAGSLSYAVSIVVCFLGLAMMGVVAWMGWRWIKGAT